MELLYWKKFFDDQSLYDSSTGEQELAIVPFHVVEVISVNR